MYSPAQSQSQTEETMQQSPLLLAMHDPVLHNFINYLTEKKEEQEENPDRKLTIEVSHDDLASMRETFKKTILDGEWHLHCLGHLLASILLDGTFELHSNVIGALPGVEARPFLIRERITRETLFSVTDVDLGNHLVHNFRYQQHGEWLPLTLSANFVEYVPLARPLSGVNRLTSRVKAEEELWNKVNDEIFALDEMLTRDKHLRHYSKFIKDIFGIKIICEDEATCLRVHEQLESMTICESDVSRMQELCDISMPIKRSSAEKLLEFIETKDYLTCDVSKMKKTGWRALKSVARWRDRLFEIQIQPLANYYMELDHMSGPSHKSFKTQRDALRDEISKVVPLYGFYRDLLKMLFMNTDKSFEYENARVVLK
jgi:ppGpp synthetase/RelA/SpoT-type nucleotidyltranferase